MINELHTIGTLKEKYLKDGIAEYLKRLSTSMPITVREFKEYTLPNDPSQALIEKGKIEEGNKILQAIDDDTFLVALDLQGKELTSPELAKNLANWQSMGKRKLVFAIGGSYGLSNEVLKRADFRLCFGKMTYPHQLMRLILVEQLYRANKINKGETYHK